MTPSQLSTAADMITGQIHAAHMLARALVLVGQSDADPADLISVADTLAAGLADQLAAAYDGLDRLSAEIYRANLTDAGLA